MSAISRAVKRVSKVIRGTTLRLVDPTRIGRKLPGSPEAIAAGLAGARRGMKSTPGGPTNTAWDVAAGGTILSRRKRARTVGRAVGTIAAAWGAGVAAGSSSFAATPAAEASIYEEAGTMSMFGDWIGTAREAVNLYGDIRATRTGGMMQPAVGPVIGGMGPMIGRGLGALGLGALPALGGLAVRGAATVARSAMTYCRRNPAWCASIGGTAAIAALIEGGQLPTIRRRRGRGITPRDLRSFRRVAGLIKNYCPTVRRLPARAVHVRRTGITHAR